MAETPFFQDSLNVSGGARGIATPSTTSPLIPERALDPSRDGCDCPPWIQRCIHFDGLLLYLGNYSGFLHAHRAHLPPPPGELYGVECETDGAWRECLFCPERILKYTSRFEAFYNGFDLDAANVAFDAAELRLLAGDLS